MSDAHEHGSVPARQLANAGDPFTRRGLVTDRLSVQIPERRARGRAFVESARLDGRKESANNLARADDCGNLSQSVRAVEILLKLLQRARNES
jgi:hypothetical protein